MTKKAVIEAPHQSSNPADAQDLLMEAGFIIDFIEEAATCAGESEHALHESCGLIYIMRDMKARIEKASQIIDAYKASREVAHHG